MSLKVLRAGPGMSVQDLGRPGYLAMGLSRGGAMDRLAIAEGAALLGQDTGLAALEMAGMGGLFEAEADLRIALTGAPMRASLDGDPLVWAASHGMKAGQKLEIGPATSGSYGYLHLGGGIDAPEMLGARAAHLTQKLGDRIEDGARLIAGADKGGPVGQVIDVEDRFTGGLLRILPTAQTVDFGQATCDRLAETRFTRDPRSNRQAVRLALEGEGFALEGGLTVLSEITQPGDLQVTGDGFPVILMAEAQTAGGYPRIGTVLPADLPRAAQAPAGVELRVTWVSVDDALKAERSAAAAKITPRPLIRDPRDISDLLSYRLIDGAIDGREDT